MMPLEYAARRPQHRKYSRHLGLLIGTACATSIDLAQAQSDGWLLDELSLPLLLCSARPLIIPIEPLAVRVPEVAFVPEVLGLRVVYRQSFAAAAPEKSGELPVASAHAVVAETKVEEPEEPVPFEAVQPGPSNPVSNAAAPIPENLPDLSAVSWALAPIRWGGNTASNYNLNDSSQGGKTYSETQTLNLRGSSYIYQPWYAQVSGDLGLLRGNSRQSGGDVAENSNGKSTSVTYGGNLNLFPQSRFPFQAYAQSSDSRADANSQGSQYTSTRMGARQSYRPEVGPENYSASADRSIVTTTSVRSVVDAVQGSYATTIADHGLSANARFSRNIGDIGGQGSNLLSLNGTHSWRADEDITVASSANYINNQISTLTSTGLSMNNSEVMQALSSVTWLPSEDLPLTVAGGGSFLHLNTETEAEKTNLTSLNAYANAIYRVNKNLTTTVGLTLSQNQTNDVNQFASAENASVSYLGNPLTFGDYSYNWGTGGAISNQQVSGGAANRSLSAQAQHSVLRNVVVDQANALTLNASQSFSITDNSTSKQSNILTHSGGASWRLGFGDRSMGMLTTTLSDSISTGTFGGHIRSLSAQGNIQSQMSSRSSLTASLNVVLSQQLSGPQVTQTEALTDPTLITDTRNRTLNGSGQVSYAYRNPFDIANLVYTATFQGNASQTNLRLITGDPNALGSQSGTMFRQNADYRLGRLTIRATSTFARLNGKDNASVFLMIGREIGDF